jgi:acyl carrier protein
LSGKKNVESIYPASRQQKGMLFETLSATRPGIHVERLAGRLHGPLDLEAFERAWQRVAARHSVLRTAFAWKGQEEPLQVVLERIKLPFEIRDLSSLSTADQEESVGSFLEDDLVRGFDMSRAPLMRLTLFRTGEQEHRLVWTHHHILMDGWCRPLVVGEVMALYEAFSRGQELDLPPVRPYHDYISWLRGKEAEMPLAESFWRETLRGVTHPNPMGIPAPPAPFDPAARHSVREARLPAGPTAVLQDFARRSRLTFNTLVQGVWALLLSRYSGELDVIFGTTVSGRPEELEGVESMIGMFITTLPFRVQVDPAAHAWTWLQGLQNRFLDLRAYEYCSAGQVHQWSEVSALTPLYESLLVFENYPVQPGEAGASKGGSGLAFEMDGAGSTGAITRHPLTVLAAEGSELTLSLIHDGRRLDGEDIARTAGHFVDLLTALAAEPEQLLGGLLERIPAAEIPKWRSLPGEGEAFRRPYVAPRTATEETLATLWAQILRVPRVGVNDSFLELGGHSLLATELLSRINAVFQLNLPLLRLYETPSLGDLAAAIVQAQAEKADAEALTRLLDEVEGMPAEQLQAALSADAPVRREER